MASNLAKRQLPYHFHVLADGTAKSPSPSDVVFQESASNRRLVYRPVVIVDADRREVDMGRRRSRPKLKTQG